MKNHARAMLATAAMLLALAAGCTGAKDTADAPRDGAPAPAGETKVAGPGLYDQGDGNTQALGTLERRDIEGGFWAVVSRMPGQEIEAEVVAVLVGAEELDADLTVLDGKYVSALGEMLDGASIRMSGPEMRVESIEEVVDTIDAGGDASGIRLEGDPDQPVSSPAE